MNKYLILGNIYGVGGWQIYIEGRICHLLSQGLKIYVISPVMNGEEIKLEYVRHIKVFPCDIVFRNPAIYTTSQQDRTIKELLNFIDYQSDDKVLVESTSIYSSFWGEYLAELTTGKNFSYILNSHVMDVIGNNNTFIDFFRFKYAQKLVAGMTHLTLKEILFQNQEVSDSELFSFKAAGRNPLTSLNTLVSQTNMIEEIKKQGTIVVGYFGNLDKPHVIPLTKELIQYFSTHKDHSFLFLTVGSSSKKKIEKKIKSIIKGQSNTETMNIGNLYPVPIQLFQLMDVCIGSWGSAKLAAQSGTKTIRLISDTTVVAQGVIGITLRDNEYYNLPIGKENLFEYLNNILFSHIYDNIPKSKITEYSNYKLIQEKIDAFISPMFSSSNFDYFSIKKIGIKTKREIIMKICNIILGTKISNVLYKILK